MGKPVFGGGANVRDKIFCNMTDKAKSADSLQSTTRQSARRKAFDIFLDQWYVRYFLGTLILCLVWSMAQNFDYSAGLRSQDWIGYIALTAGACIGLWYVREIAVYGALFIGGWCLFSSSPGLGVSGAIIIGACIIAFAIYQTRRRN